MLSRNHFSSSNPPRPSCNRPTLRWAINSGCISPMIVMDYFFQGFPIGYGTFLFCWIAQSSHNKHTRLLGDPQNLLHFLFSESTDPANSKSFFPSGENQVLHGNGDVQLPLLLSIVSNPSFFRKGAFHDDRRRKPVLVASGPQFFLYFGIRYYYETPRLTVER